jgi:anti-sigma regulatory factor (Ser/Thr protein kinase)
VDRKNTAVADLLNRAATAQREADFLCARAATLVRHHQPDGRARPGTIRRCYPAQPSSVPLARAAVMRLAMQAGMSPPRLDAVRLAVSEAVTNAAVHAYPSSPGQIHLTAALAQGELTVLVADDGVGPHTEPRNPGPGWGWPLMTSCSDMVTVTERGTGGTLVAIRWNMGVDSHAAFRDAASVPAGAD